MFKKKIFYSKSSKILSEINLIDKKQNINELNKRKKFVTLYNKGQKNYNCIICGCKLSKNKDFEFHKINYFFCTKCHHLNGSRKLNNKKLHQIYKAKSLKSSIYYKNYSKKYNKRAKEIYKPKLDFLKKILKKPNILDFGCGAGHFISACNKENVNCIGAEVDKNLIELAPLKIKKKNII